MTHFPPNKESAVFNILANDGYWYTTAVAAKIAGTPQNNLVVIPNFSTISATGHAVLACGVRPPMKQESTELI